MENPDLKNSLGLNSAPATDNTTGTVPVLNYILTDGTDCPDISKEFRLEQQNKQLTAENLQLREQNEQYQKEIQNLQKLFALLSHDLRSPIDIITGCLVASSEHEFSKNERAQIDAELLSRVNATSDLLANLLTWSKAQLHGIKPRLAKISMKVMLLDALANLTLKARKKGIALTDNMPDDLEVICDREMFLVVFRNIVNNAIKFTPVGGMIDIGLIEKDNTAVITVKDSGIGIPAGRKNEVFNLNFNSTYGTNNEKGVGLGLKLCKEFLEYQHGNIWFESEEGKGSVFYISVPLAGK